MIDLSFPYRAQKPYWPAPDSQAREYRPERL